MLAIAAAILFAIAFLLNATSTSTDAVFSPMSLLLVGSPASLCTWQALAPAGKCPAAAVAVEDAGPGLLVL
jgi:hypothetical protein